MATTAGTVATTVKSRLRTDTGTVCIADAFMYQVLDLVQRYLNFALKRVTKSGTLTTAGSTLVYTTTSAIAADCAEVLMLYDGARTVPKLPDWRALAHYDRDWLTRTGTRFEAWAPLGADLIIVYPAKTGASSLSCVYVTETTLINGSGINYDMPDEDVCTNESLAEIIFLFHLRQLTELDDRMKHIIEGIVAMKRGIE